MFSKISIYNLKIYKNSSKNRSIERHNNVAEQLILTIILDRYMFKPGGS